MSSEVFPLYGQGTGYGLVIGISAFYAIGMTLLSFYLKKFFREVQDSEMYLTAKRSIKAGLIASSVVSSWTLSATLLTSTTFTYLYGASAAFWYGAGCCCQIFFFAVAAIELKAKAPHAHTFLEVVKMRYGSSAHLILAFYSMVYQYFISVNLLVGAGQIFKAVTGMAEEATCFLFPIGVAIYTLFGGLKSTFLTDWVHTCVIYIITLVSLFVLYATSNLEFAGSPDKIYELLVQAAIDSPVADNANGSYLTMRSFYGGLVGLIFLGGGFSACVDSQLFQKAIAAHPKSTFLGYTLGGLCWFTVPFCLATTYGLGARALENTPAFATYPEPMTTEQINNSLVMPFLAYTIMGKGGVIAILIALFQAVTSALSSETVAITSLFTYDIFRTYIKPDATGKQLVFFSRIILITFLIVIASSAVGFCHAGFSVSFIVTAIGILIDGAVIPSACTLFWRKQSKYAVTLVPVISSMASISTWIGVAYHKYGAVNITTLSEFIPTVAGNMLALGAPIVLTPLITFIKPENYDFEQLKTLTKADDSGFFNDGDSGSELANALEEEENKEFFDELPRRRRRGIIVSSFIVISLCILWPIPMYGTSYVFSTAFFRGWIVVTFIFAFLASGTIILMPIIESRKRILRFLSFMLNNASRSKNVSQDSEEIHTDDVGEKDARSQVVTLSLKSS